MKRASVVLSDPRTDPALAASYTRDQRTTLAGRYFVIGLLGLAMARVFVFALGFVLSPRPLAIARIACAWVALFTAAHGPSQRHR